MVIIERKPRSHDVKGFVHAKVDLHLAKQQNKTKQKKKREKKRKKERKKRKQTKQQKKKLTTHLAHAI